jgi:signal transduction histidine kinase
MSSKWISIEELHTVNEELRNQGRSRPATTLTIFSTVLRYPVNIVLDDMEPLLRDMLDTLTTKELDVSLITRELHADISQKLVVIDMELQKLSQHLPAQLTEARQQLEQAREQIATLSEEVRGLSHQLHPSATEHLELPAVLRSLVEEFGEREEMVTTFQRSSVPEKLPSKVAAALYRITQEALRNVAKHADRTHVQVCLEGTDEGLRLTGRDFGAGFDLEERGPRSLGLVSMEERARLAREHVPHPLCPGRGHGYHSDDSASWRSEGVTSCQIFIPS